MKTQATFSELLQAYFTQRLMHECNASPHTIANYRDTFRLLIGFAHRQLKKPPTVLAMQDLDASFVCRFLDAGAAAERVREGIGYVGHLAERELALQR